MGKFKKNEITSWESKSFNKNKKLLEKNIDKESFANASKSLMRLYDIATNKIFRKYEELVEDKNIVSNDFLTFQIMIKEYDKNHDIDEVFNLINLFFESVEQEIINGKVVKLDNELVIESKKYIKKIIPIAHNSVEEFKNSNVISTNQILKNLRKSSLIPLSGVKTIKFLIEAIITNIKNGYSVQLGNFIISRIRFNSPDLMILFSSKTIININKYYLKNLIKTNKAKSKSNKLLAKKLKEKQNKEKQIKLKEKLKQEIKDKKLKDKKLKQEIKDKKLKDKKLEEDKSKEEISKTFLKNNQKDKSEFVNEDISNDKLGYEENNETLKKEFQDKGSELTRVFNWFKTKVEENSKKTQIMNASIKEVKLKMEKIKELESSKSSKANDNISLLKTQIIKLRKINNYENSQILTNKSKEDLDKKIKEIKEKIANDLDDLNNIDKKGLIKNSRKVINKENNKKS